MKLNNTKNNHAGGSLKVVLTALVVNAVVTIAKFAGFFLSLSPSMLAESIHSFADTANQILIYIGIKVSKKKPTRDFPFGYGQARYLWNLVSATGIFFIGFGVTTYHGIISLFHHHEANISYSIAIPILIFAFFGEGYTLHVALKDVRGQKGSMTLREWIKNGDDPTSAGILIEDAIAVIGVVLAVAGMLLSHYFESYIFDSIATILIGLLLGVMAITMGYANGRLLINRSVNELSERDIKNYILALPEIKTIYYLSTEIMSPDDIRLSMEFDLNIDPVLKKEKANIDENKFQNFVKMISQTIKNIENNIKKKFPEITHVDLEITTSEENGDSLNI